jgi:uncharacterized protein (TIGR01777 family)
MTYLITGATGFIGGRLTGSLLSGGHSVNYLGRRRSGQLDARAAYHCWGDETSLLESVPRVDAIVHLMGEPVSQRWTPEVKRRIHESRVVGTRQLVSAIRLLKHRPSVLVSASAVGFYGDRGDEVLGEGSEIGAGFLADLCHDWEAEAVRAEELGLRVVRVRIGVVLGREGGALSKMLLPFRLGLGGRLGDGRQWIPWIHVDDLIRMIVFAAESESIRGPLNGSSPNPVTNAEFTRVLASALRRPAFLPMPKFALQLALGEMADFLFSSLRVLPRASEEAGFTFHYPRLDAALRALLAN